ncbi:MAG: hypothetical protein IPL56_05425 [Saprospiraceae bacterium]|nr:hypothetical protein [Saprospiraceae bacterium]
MFFHNITKIHRKEDVTEILDTIFSENKDIIIPLVSPNTIFGKFLLEDKNTEFLSEYSGDNINIVYLAKNNIDKYALFIRKIISLIEEYSSKNLEEPSIIVFNKERKMYISLMNLATLILKVNLKSLIFKFWML